MPGSPITTSLRNTKNADTLVASVFAESDHTPTTVLATSLTSFLNESI